MLINLSALAPQECDLQVMCFALCGGKEVIGYYCILFGNILVILELFSWFVDAQDGGTPLLK